MTMFRRLSVSTAAFALAVSAAALPVWAQGDAGLYEPVPDPDASFVRVIAPAAEFGTIASEAMTQMEDVTPYVSVLPGEVPVQVGDLGTTVSVEKGGFYTVALAEGAEPTTLRDTIIASPAKADLAFYNLTDLAGLSLYVPAAKANVAEGIDPSGMFAIALKAPLTLDFEVHKDGEVIATIPAVELRRKEGVTVVVTGTGGSYSGIATNNVFLY